MFEKDPENRLLSRMYYKRLEVEAIRDSILAVSGRLNRKVFGTSVYPPVAAQALEGSSDSDKIWKSSPEKDASRRTVYAFLKRSMIVPMLDVLDLCDTARFARQYHEKHSGVKRQNGFKRVNYLKCSCPIWCDGELNGKRYRISLGTRDLGRAGNRLAKLEAPDAPSAKSLTDAIRLLMQHCESLQPSTQRKYQNLMNHLAGFRSERELIDVSEIALDVLDEYRAWRGASHHDGSEAPLSRTTATKELQTLRQFFAFCHKRKWTHENPAKDTKLPKAKPAKSCPIPSKRERPS